MAEVPETPVVPRGEDRMTVGEVLRTIRDLPPKQREVLKLRFCDGHSYRGISERTGLSVSYVGFLLHTSLKSVRGQLALGAGLLVVLLIAVHTLSSTTTVTREPGKRDVVPPLLQPTSEPSGERREAQNTPSTRTPALPPHAVAAPSASAAPSVSAVASGAPTSTARARVAPSGRLADKLKPKQPTPPPQNHPGPARIPKPKPRAPRYELGF